MNIIIMVVAQVSYGFLLYLHLLCFLFLCSVSPDADEPPEQVSVP